MESIGKLDESIEVKCRVCEATNRITEFTDRMWITCETCNYRFPLSKKMLEEIIVDLLRQMNTKKEQALEQILNYIDATMKRTKKYSDYQNPGVSMEMVRYMKGLCTVLEELQTFIKQKVMG